MTNTLIIFDWHRTLYNPDEGVLMNGALELIQALKGKGVDLALISKAMEEDCDWILSFLPDGCFKKVILTSMKTPELFQSMNSEGRYDRVIVVGDRIKGEIYCANKAGYETIWFKGGKFVSEVPNSPDEKPDHVIDELGEVLDLL
jgi:phosphoglycolate phosphatase-like HAD superfamily hydrolase